MEIDSRFIHVDVDTLEDYNNLMNTIKESR
jgi:hypothetical protein